MDNLGKNSGGNGNGIRFGGSKRQPEDTVSDLHIGTDIRSRKDLVRGTTQVSLVRSWFRLQ